MKFTDWESAARSTGWLLASECDDRPREFPLGALRNDELGRDWPSVDWRAAAEDAGIQAHEVTA